MPGITRADIAAFRTRGYVVVPGALDDRQLTSGRATAAAMLAAHPPPADQAGPYFLWPRFEGGDASGLLAFYRDSGIAQLAAGLLRPDLAVGEPDFAQLGTTIPPWPHRPGGPHVDGLTPPEPDGRPGTFTLLAGAWLSDQSSPNQGNLWIWPGTHLRFATYLAEHGADALARLHPAPYAHVGLGEPVQVTGPTGSVVFAHYLLGHNIGGHDGPAGAPARQVVYYRLHATGHRARWRDAVISPLLEFGDS
jgi:hypothetical protein